MTPLTPPRDAPLTRRLLGFLRPSALALAALATCACSKSAAPLAPALADVVFQGSADGPALDALLAVAPKASTDAAPITDGQRMDKNSYQQFAAEGLPRGSGVVEAACETLVTQRMKQSGMRWGEDGGQAILTVRGWTQSGDRFDGRGRCWPQPTKQRW